MITLTQKEKNALKEIIVKHFDLTPKDLHPLLNNIDLLLSNNDSYLFDQLEYLIYFHDNAEYTHKIFLSVFEIYTYLQSIVEKREQKEFLNQLFIDFYESTFYENCKYNKKSHKRNETIQNILKYVSDKLNGMLTTQQLMITNMSHEMRTQLNSMIGYLTLIEKENILQGDTKIFLNKATKASLLLKALLTDVLDISKLNSDQMEINPSVFWLDEIILDSIRPFIIQINEKQLEFKSNIAFFPYQVYADGDRIFEILKNILSNAVKYTEQGYIHLTIDEISEKNQEVELLFKIEDSGIGMSSQQIKNIFDPYTRHAHDIQGLGLGLYISKKLLQKMDSDLSVSSELEKGSTFEFRLRFKQITVDSFSLLNKQIYFFNNQKDAMKQKKFEKKLKLLERMGAIIESFDDEETFTGFLLSNKESEDFMPNIISITTQKDQYSKYDALISYLKNFKKFQHTYFMAEETNDQLSFEHFDKSFEHFSTLSSYIKAIKMQQQQGVISNKVDRPLQILAIDDIETNLDMLSLFIKKKYPNTIVDKALGGYEAIGMYKVNQYDLVFLDLKMPGLNGFEVFERLRSIASFSPIYALTADVYKETYDKVMETGFNGLIEKPLKLDRLYDIIEEIRYV
ncbi:MAG: hybrid sensor histidine kinase/response regulator [Campylobacterota bacterium]|nr:hybrid sensor histidine kinase/response regulator [Campylobacterota bacterium]